MGNIDTDALYERAKRLLSRPLSPESLRELQEIHARVATSVPPHRKVQKSSKSPEFVPYPDVTSPDFQRVLNAKKEFRKYALEAVAMPSSDAKGVDELWSESCGARRFALTPNQLFLKDFISPTTPYNSLLLFHGVGVGKTCSAVTVAERFPDRKVLVLVNPGLQANFRKEIFDPDKLSVDANGKVDFSQLVVSGGCTGSAYLDRIPERHLLSKEAIERRIARMIADKYTFMGPRQFAHYVAKLGQGPQSVERIRAKFSNTLIVVDEAHHLRVVGAQGEKMVTPALRRVLQDSEGIKLLLLTATPMFNDARDVIELVNLMLLNDKRPRIRVAQVFDTNGRITRDGVAVLSDAVRGYVSYMRGDSPFSFPLRLSPAANGDPAVLRPARMPALDLRGAPIPEQDRLRSLDICASPMSAYQARVYGSFEEQIAQVQQPEEQLVDADADDYEVVESAGGPDAAKPKSMLHTGLQICNIVFPAQAPGAPRHGIDAMLNCFNKVSSRPLQLAYKPGVPAFLEPGARGLGSYAPKMQSIVQRILSSRGIVFVYSRFIWMGLLPLAIALEHAGFQRYGGRPVLVRDQKNQHLDTYRNPKSARQSYCILCGMADLTGDMTADIAAARSPDNRDGSVIKVILASEVATEGIDLRNVREVHILDPWYHLNKVEQILGRAGRLCSHASLPLEDRNVTLFLHAASAAGHARETIDLRAYRIAEIKHKRMQEVRRVLVANAVDCPLNRERLFYDRNKLGVNLDIVTSQGTRKRVPLGDAVDGLSSHVPVTCRSGPPGRGPEVHDDTTYDVRVHLHGIDDHVRAVQLFFERSGAPIAATFGELHAFVRNNMRAAYQQEELMAALQRMVADETRIRRLTSDVGPAGPETPGPEGYLVYRGDKYLFQPVHASSKALTLQERASASAPAEQHVRLVAPASSPSPVSKRATSSRSASARSKRATSRRSVGIWDPANVMESMQRRIMQTLGQLPAQPDVLLAYLPQLVDSVVDRLSTQELLGLVQHVVVSAMDDKDAKSEKNKGLNPKAAANMADIKRSLVEGGLLLPATASDQHKLAVVCDPSAATVTYYNLVAAGRRVHHWEPCQPITVQAAQRELRAKLKLELELTKYTGYIMFSETGPVFKIVGESKGSEGCVCHQTSTLTVAHIVKSIAKLDKSLLDPTRRTDKRGLCGLYELVLRKRAPAQLLRPVALKWIMQQRAK